MIATLLSLLGGGLGGLLRFVPEIFKMLADQKDRDHEYRMTQLQLEIDQARAKDQIDLVHAQGDMAVNSIEADAWLEAIKSQGKPTGIAWVDALNASVRPVITYWWMSLFTVYKACTIYTAIVEVSTLDAFVAELWTPQDAGILAMILGFWFVDRAMRKNTGR